MPALYTSTGSFFASRADTNFNTTGSGSSRPANDKVSIAKLFWIIPLGPDVIGAQDGVTMYLHKKWEAMKLIGEALA